MSILKIYVLFFIFIKREYLQLFIDNRLGINLKVNEFYKINKD